MNLLVSALEGEHARAEWAIDRLREMNHRAKRLGVLLSESTPAKRPAEPLRIKQPESVAEWLRYLLHKARSQAGEVRAHGRVLRQASPRTGAP